MINYLYNTMEKTNALKLRQSLGAILKKLQKNGEPILIEKGREPAAVLITLEDYKKRFVDKEADSLREQLVEKILNAKIELPKGKSSLDLIKELRS